MSLVAVVAAVLLVGGSVLIVRALLLADHVFELAERAEQDSAPAAPDLRRAA